MFLKRIEMQGFKSFADKTVISFTDPITGVVGPNGCGKSNIADAVRWVLGEQSARSMRGEKMNDVIFAGSADRRKVNMAEVTLVFDNSSHILNDERDEIEVTRRLYRDSNEAEYLINHNNVRLKDIVDLFLDTGLGKDSLSIISQGNVVSFAEAKPYERRGIFEEAAGVAKFKKRKLESLSRLERTKDNLERSQDILAELEKQVSPLKRQARKAELYREKKARLQEIEISVLVKDIDSINREIEAAKKSLFEIETEITMNTTGIQVSERRIQESRNRINDLDRRINALQDSFMSNANDIHSLETRKTELDEKKKYIVETGTSAEKEKELKGLVEEAKAEYEDRQKRLDQLHAEIDLASQNLSDAALKIMDARTELDSTSMKLRNLENRKNVLESLMRNPFNSQAGVAAIMNARHSLKGILGVIGQLFTIEKGYEEALSTALGGSMNNIVTTDEQAARDAIRFLNRNMSGRATFLPITVCKPRTVRKEDLIVAQNTEGYLGCASDFVQCDNRFVPVSQNLLGNVLVVDSMECGNRLSALTNRMYKIVTLDGEVIHRGGSMTGGKTKHNTNLVTMKKEAADIASRMDSAKAAVALAQKKLEEAENRKESISTSLQDKRFACASLEQIVAAKQDKYEKLKNELALINPQSLLEDQESHVNELIVRLNTAYSQRDEITRNISSCRNERMKLANENERREAQLRQMRKDLSVSQDNANAIRVDQGKLETKLENCLNRLSSEYQMTYEYALTKVTDEPVENAREEVAQLRSEIEHLGNVNMNAPEEYEEVNTRYETLKQQIDELTESRDKILAAIDEMDTVMKKQFKETFDAINVQFNDIFRSLYGGGKARLILLEPDDILNSGIDIDAQPPGKAVTNNMLFSGGEKSLIALCVLFAILKVKPVPLVILDEVEAALDPGNVERFAQFLHNYTQRTQFIVVTHRVGTMEKADILYGVTMQKQGVSQMLKVELKDAMKMADTKEGGQS
ncbi:MAG: chromosome segregation protein SMC [Bulleidia sp.]